MMKVIVWWSRLHWIGNRHKFWLNLLCWISPLNRHQWFLYFNNHLIWSVHFSALYILHFHGNFPCKMFWKYRSSFFLFMFLCWLKVFCVPPEHGSGVLFCSLTNEWKSSVIRLPSFSCYLFIIKFSSLLLSIKAFCNFQSFLSWSSFTSSRTIVQDCWQIFIFICFAIFSSWIFINFNWTISFVSLYVWSFWTW